MTSTPEDMEIMPAESSTTTTAPTQSNKNGAWQVVLDDNHPFDLENYMSSYSGRTAQARAIFIAQHAPSLAPQAYKIALRSIQEGCDVNAYLTTLAAYHALPDVSSIRQDQRWVDEKVTKNAKERERLEVDLKTYASNMIKESVRMSHRELGKYYYTVGDYPASLRNHTKSREFCTTATHVIEMCISVLEILLEQNNYAHLSTYIYKAETALEASQSTAGAKKAAAGAGSTSGAGAATGVTPTFERTRIQGKLKFAQAMVDMSTGKYEKAAYLFVQLPQDLGDWVGKVVSPGDIAIYGTLCALAGMTRSAIKAAVLESDTFGYYLEHEPHVREILDAYMGSKFKDVLLLLDKYSTRHRLDIHISNHVTELHRQVRNRALVLYFQPFASVHLGKMATAFGMDLADMEASVVKLIEDGQIKARIDSQEKILKAKDHDPRIELYNRAVAAGLDVEASTRKVLWRMRLIQNEIFIKAPKNRDRGGDHPQTAQLAGWDSPPE